MISRQNLHVLLHVTDIVPVGNPDLLPTTTARLAIDF